MLVFGGRLGVYIDLSSKICDSEEPIDFSGNTAIEVRIQLIFAIVIRNIYEAFKVKLDLT